MNIHHTAVVSTRAKIGRDCTFGPFCVIEDDVKIGDGCVFEPFSVVKSGSILGDNNHVCEGAIIGGLPQCVGLDDTRGLVVIGNGNSIREHCTIHRSMKDQDATEIGDNCMFMVNAHIAHDCRIGNDVIIANNAMLAGHVTVGNRANISGAVGVHQFCRIGSLAMVGGQSHVVRDIPPYVMVDGKTTAVVGLNTIGLRRAGFSSDDIKELKSVYRLLYNTALPWREIIQRMEKEFTTGPGLEMAKFIAMTTRGITMERRSSRHPQPVSDESPETLKFHVVG